MIDWLNANSGFVISLLTVIYVISTIIIVRAMATANKLMKDQIELQKKQIESQKRPYVYFDIQIIDRIVYAILNNYSEEPAFNIRAELDKKIEVKPIVGPSISPQLTSHKIAYLAPKREIGEFIAVSPDFLKQISNPLFLVNISYEDKNSKKYEDQYPIDLNYHKQMISRKGLVK